MCGMYEGRESSADVSVLGVVSWGSGEGVKVRWVGCEGAALMKSAVG